jgi:hypothetical protein
LNAARIERTGPEDHVTGLPEESAPAAASSVWTAERVYWALMGLVWLLLSLPAALVRFPPLHDYPNHLARIFILGQLDESPALRNFYATEWLPYPNLGMDLLVTPVADVIGAEAAGRWFLVLLPTLFLFGADRVARGLHGRFSFAAPLAAFFFFNTLYFYGFVNYVFGVGLFLCAYALWLAHFRKPSGGRFVAMVVVATAAYLAHKTALAFLGVAMFVTMVVEYKELSLRRVLPQVAVLAPSALIELFGNVPKVAAGIDWETPFGKVKGLASLIATYRPFLDLALTALFIGLLIFFGRRAGRPHRVALLTAVVFAVLFVVFPTGVGGTWAADRRFFVPAAVFAVLCLTPDLRKPAARWAYLAALALVVVRAGGVLAEWPRLSDDVAARVALLDTVPRGARVFGFALVDKKNKSAWTREMRLVYAHHYAAIDRDAYVNGLFVHANQQPLRLRDKDPVGELPALDRAPGEVDWANIFGHHEYVFATKIDETYRQFLGARCQLLGTVKDAALYTKCHL